MVLGSPSALVVLCVATIAAFIALYWVLMTLVGRRFFSALPQVEAVLRVVGATSA